MNHTQEALQVILQRLKEERTTAFINGTAEFNKKSPGLDLAIRITLDTLDDYEPLTRKEKP